ncbi:MAG: hypothetical protein ACLP0J_16875 [Solirubrobacteraceae bacterium]
MSQQGHEHVVDDVLEEGRVACITDDEKPVDEAVAAVLSRVSGRTVRRLVLDDEDFVGEPIEHGMPEPFARLFLGT